VVLDRDDVLNWVSLRNAPQVHLIEAGQLNTYDVLVADEVVFTETALAEYVAGPAKGKGRGVEKPDLTTPDIPGAIPSMLPPRARHRRDDHRCRGAGQEGRCHEGARRRRRRCRGSGRRAARHEGACEEGLAEEGAPAKPQAADETTEEQA
jgi:large subunit ribosomal protein L4